MIVAALSLIVLLTLALITSVAVIVHDLDAEQRIRPESDDVRVPLAA